MTRILTAALAIAVASPAIAGDNEITLKAGTVPSIAAELAEEDPTGGWIAVPAEPCASRTKADILIESLGDTTDPLSVCYETELLRETPWGTASGTVDYTLHAVGDITLKRGIDSGVVEGDFGELGAWVEAPRDYTLADMAVDNAGYLAVATDGTALFIFPPFTFGLIGVEPDEID